MYIELLEKYNEAKHSKYPIIESASMQSINGVLLPASFIVDISITFDIPEDTTTTNTFYISKVLKNSDGTLRVVIGHTDGSTASDILISDTINTADKVYLLTQTPDSSFNCSGKIAIGDLKDIIHLDDLFFAAPLGTETLKNTIIEAICINNNNNNNDSTTGITSVSLVDSDNRTHVITTDFTLAAGDGITFDISTENDETIVTVNRVAIYTDTGNTEDAIAEIKKALGNPILTINGVSGDSKGNINLTGDDCTSVQSISNGVRIENPCSTPCCSDADVSTLEGVLNTLQESRDRLQSYLDSVSTNINTMQARLSAIIAANK